MVKFRAFARPDEGIARPDEGIARPDEGIPRVQEIERGRAAQVRSG
jgi:hypothetical protein